MSKFIVCLFVWNIVVTFTKASEQYSDEDFGLTEKTNSPGTAHGNLCLLECRKEEFEPCFRRCYREHTCLTGTGSNNVTDCLEPPYVVVYYYIVIYQQYYGEAYRKCHDRNLQWYNTGNEIFCPLYCETNTEPNAESNCYLNGFTGCACMPGFARRDDGECVEPQYCSVFSTADESLTSLPLTSCGNDCLNTCRYGAFESCFRKCYHKCLCPTGVGHRGDGFCEEISDRTLLAYTLVHEKQLGITSQRCYQPNQQFYGPGTFCPRYCGETERQPCYKGSKSGCSCVSGTVRRNDSSCVTPNECNNIFDLPFEQLLF